MPLPSMPRLTLGGLACASLAAAALGQNQPQSQPQNQPPASAAAGPRIVHAWEKRTLSKEFFSEGAHFADLDKDGHMDIVAGGLWFRGPDFADKREYYAAKPFSPNVYSKHFLTYVADVNADGHTDIIVLGFPGELVNLYLNPGTPEGLKGHWPRHDVVNGLDNESPVVGDLTKSGKAQVIGSFKGAFGYWTAGPDATKPWTFHPVSPGGKAGGKFTHGLGYGDVNGDGRLDLLEKNGWWEQPASLEGDPLWAFRPFSFSGGGGAQMYAYDVDGDGRNDVITSIEAHGFGLAWFQNVDDGKGGITFKKNIILDRMAEQNKYGLVFTQMHAIALLDMDGDGVKDIVTGKRWWAHGPKGDPQSDQPAVLYWFRLVRDPAKGAAGVDFVPYLIDNDSGVGTQIEAGDVNGDKHPDVIVGNKKGVYVLLQKPTPATAEEWEKAQPKPYVKPAK